MSIEGCLKKLVYLVIFDLNFNIIPHHTRSKKPHKVRVLFITQDPYCYDLLKRLFAFPK